MFRRAEKELAVKSIHWALALVASGFGGVAFGQDTGEAPQRPGLFVFQNARDEATRQAEEAQRRVAEVQRAFEQMKREKGAYLGVGTGAPSPALRKQLGLTPGMGLMV